MAYALSLLSGNQTTGPIASPNFWRNTKPPSELYQVVPSWKPVLGASYSANQVSFRVWAPDAQSLTLVLDSSAEIAMVKSPDGYFTICMEGVSPGSSYSFFVDGSGPFPDPASRYQPA